MRRHASVIVDNTTTQYHQCLGRVEEVYRGKLGYDDHRQACVSKFKKELEKEQANIANIYEGYMSNFKTTDGSLIKGVKGFVRD